MKKITLVTLVTLSAVVFGATQVSAAPGDKGEIEASKGFKSDTTVKIIDNNDGSDVDPLDPSKPDQTMLILTEVPSNFDFSTKISNKTYNITSGEATGSIKVLNDRIDRDWSVKATLKDNQIKKSDDVVFDVTSFKVNGEDITATGSKPVATAVAAADRNTQTNSGTLSREITGLEITFTDTDNTLKVDDALTGTVNYSLYNTMNAQ